MSCLLLCNSNISTKHILFSKVLRDQKHRTTSRCSASFCSSLPAVTKGFRTNQCSASVSVAQISKQDLLCSLAYEKTSSWLHCSGSCSFLLSQNSGVCSLCHLSISAAQISRLKFPKMRRIPNYGTPKDQNEHSGAQCSAPSVLLCSVVSSISRWISIFCFVPAAQTSLCSIRPSQNTPSTFAMFDRLPLPLIYLDMECASCFWSLKSQKIAIPNYMVGGVCSALLDCSKTKPAKCYVLLLCFYSSNIQICRISLILCSSKSHSNQQMFFCSAVSKRLSTFLCSVHRLTRSNT